MLEQKIVQLWQNVDGSGQFITVITVHDFRSVRRPKACFFCEWPWQDMLTILRSECAKPPGLRNWVGNNTDIRVLMLNVLCQIQSWTLHFYCALGSLVQAALWVLWSKQRMLSLVQAVRVRGISPLAR